MIKLYLDEDVHKKVAIALRLKGYDVISAHEMHKQSLSDFQQLEQEVFGINFKQSVNRHLQVS